MTRVLVEREESKIAVDAGGRGGCSFPWWSWVRLRDSLARGLRVCWSGVVDEA